MQELTTVSTSTSFLTTSSQSSPINLAQPLLTALGWKDLKPAIVAAEQADQALALELQQAYDAYSKTPDDASQQRLQMALDQTIGELQADLARVQKLEKEATKRLTKPQTSSGGYLASWGSWLKQNAQSFFGSDDASLVERYAGIAQQRQEDIAALSRLREGLAAQVAEEQTLASTTEQESIEDVISPLSRRLLQLQSAPTVTQYCYPTGRCDLSNLHEGLSGFVLQGEDGASGASVSSAGDINGDGFPDMLIGTLYTLKTYVVFGSNQTNAWSSGILDLNSLMNGQQGFVLQGETANDHTGSSVSSAGDINGDGLVDMLVGANGADPTNRTDAGKTYVIFGSNQSDAWGTGALNLTSLMDGQRGFVLQGEAAGDSSGTSISGAGDINSDGFADMLVGAPYADSNNRTDTGKTYVVFGSNQTNAWGSGVLNLTSLMDGQRGFVLQGETGDDHSGNSVSSVGDINSDGIADIIVGAYEAAPPGRPYAGKSYVIFGSNQTSAWSSGVLNLTSLADGQRGFVLQGEMENDASGVSVSSAGDINGDSIADVLVSAGAYYNTHDPRNAGRTYVVFGSNQTNAWGSGVLNLTSLTDGQRGFVLLGEAPYDASGVSVSSAGDINGDGLADILIGAWNANPAGKSYVVFGSNQSNTWGSGILNLGSLVDGQRSFALLGEAYQDGAGCSVSSAGDINGDGLDDVLMGARGADPIDRYGAGKTYVVFGARPAQLWANQLTIYRGQTLTLGAQNLNATDSRPVSFNITSVAHGQFEYINSPNQAVTLFNQSQVWAGQVQFVHDGTSNPPSYSVQFGSGLTKLPPQNATILFYGFGNQLTIHQAENLWMSDAFLDIVGSYPADQVNITISDLQHGGFFLAPANSSVVQFTQAQLLAGNVLFAHDGSTLAPSYNVTITDPSRTVISSAEVTFYRRPSWLSNQLSLTQSDQLFLSNRHINITEDQAANKVQFIISGLQHGQFKLAPGNNTVTQFTQQQLLAGQVFFIHDKTGVAPAYQLTLNDSYFVLPPQPATINFTALPPVLGNNRLSTLQGRSVTLSSADLNATDPDPTLSDSALVFTVSNIQHGQFTINGSLAAVTQFSQAQIKQGRVVFTQNDSITAPSYQIAVGNPYRNTTFTAASIFFDKRPTMINNRLTIETGESVVLAPTNLQAVDDQTPSAELLFAVDTVEHGYFSELQAPDVSITTFSQQRVRDFEIQFTHDGNSNAPSYAVKVTDGSGLESSQAASVQVNFKNTIAAAGGVNWQAIYASLSTIGGVILSAAGYFWWRRRVASHRRGYDFANNLRKAANLEYHDFMRFDGEVYKTKVDAFVAQLKLPHSDFYGRLTPAEKKSFAVCVAETLQDHKLLAPSDCGDALYGWFFGFSVGWSRKLDVKAFEKQVSEIARQSVATWQAEEHPLTRWPYQSPTYKDKAKAWCCPRPSKAGVFSPRGATTSRLEQGVALEDIKHSRPSSPSVHKIDGEDVAIAVKGGTSSTSPRFFGESSTTVMATEDRLKLFEQQVAGQFQQVSGQLHQISESMQSMRHEIAGNIKTISDRVDQLESETQPLLMSTNSSSS